MEDKAIENTFSDIRILILGSLAMMSTQNTGPRCKQYDQHQFLNQKMLTQKNINEGTDRRSL